MQVITLWTKLFTIFCLTCPAFPDLLFYHFLSLFCFPFGVHVESAFERKTFAAYTWLQSPKYFQSNVSWPIFLCLLSCFSRSSHCGYQLGRLKTSPLTHPYHPVPCRPSPEALPQLSFFPRGSLLGTGGLLLVDTVSMDGRPWKTCLSETDGEKMMRERKIKREREWERFGIWVKQRGREKRGEAHSGEDKVLPFFPLVFDGPVDVFSFPSFFFRSRDWITRVKPPGVSPSLPTPFFPPIYALSDHLRPWLRARSPWQPCPLECERKYFAHFYYLFICCWRCAF